MIVLSKFISESIVVQAMHIFFKNHLKKLQTNIITRINISITINQIDKHKAKYIITVCIPIIILKNFLLFFFIVYKNELKEHKFNNKNIKKSDFYNRNKKICNIDDIDVNKILVSKKEQYGKYNSFKYFIGFNDNDVIRPLYLFISQTTGYINKFQKNKITMSLMVEDKKLLENYKKIWKKIKRLMYINFESKATHDNK